MISACIGRIETDAPGADRPTSPRSPRHAWAEADFLVSFGLLGGRDRKTMRRQPKRCAAFECSSSISQSRHVLWIPNLIEKWPCGQGRAGRAHGKCSKEESGRSEGHLTPTGGRVLQRFHMRKISSHAEKAARLGITGRAPWLMTSSLTSAVRRHSFRPGTIAVPAGAPCYANAPIMELGNSGAGAITRFGTPAAPSE